MKKILFFAVALLTAMTIHAQQWEIDARLGYAIGGTVPLGFPAELRELNGYSPKANYRFGIDVERHLNDKYGIQAGLYFERHGFKGDVTVKQFDVVLRQGGEKITGPYTGDVVANINQTCLTLPVQGVLHLNESCKLKFGPYIQYVSDRQFEGYAYGHKVYDADGNWTGSFDAYLRRGEVRGEKVEVGDIYTDENGVVVDKRGTFDGPEFNKFLRRMQVGVNLGCDYYVTKRIGVSADLSYGFNSAFNSEDGNPVSMGLHPLYFTVGAIYRLK